MGSRRRKSSHKPPKNIKGPPAIDPEAQAEIDYAKYNQIAILQRYSYEVAHGIDTHFRMIIDLIQRIKMREARERTDQLRGKRNGGPING